MGILSLWNRLRRLLVYMKLYGMMRDLHMCCTISYIQNAYIYLPRLMLFPTPQNIVQEIDLPTDVCSLSKVIFITYCVVTRS